MTIAHIFNGELGFDVRAKLNALIDLAGGGIAPFTQGSVLFADPSGNLTQDNANFFWDDTNNALKISGTKALYKKAHAFTDNWFVGGAGNFTLTGQGNVGIGDEALRDLTTGTFNMALGATALQRLTTGNQNTAIGGSAGQFLVTGSGNVAIGANAIGDNDGSVSSVAIGDNCFAGNRDFGNTGVGFEAGSDLQHFGAFNTMIGFKVGKVLPDNSAENTWIGAFQGTGGFTPISNTIIITDGENADSGNDVVDTGMDFHFTNSNIWSFTKRNTAIGIHLYKTINFARPPTNYERATFDWTTAANVLTIGTQAGGTGTLRPVNIIGSALTFNGSPVGGGGGMAIGGAITSATAGSVLFADTGGVLAQDNANFYWDTTHKSLNVSGVPALYKVPTVGGDSWFEAGAGNFTVTGSYNFGTGGSALASVTTGGQNFAVGSQALLFCTTGYNNTAIGAATLAYCASGHDNFAFGQGALQNTQSDFQNMGIGKLSLYNLGTGGAGSGTSQGNIAIGASALQQMLLGSSNIAIGDNVGGSISTSGAFANTFIGTSAGDSLSGGYIQNNILIGYYSGSNLTGTSIRNTWIGGYQGPSATVSSTIVISDGYPFAALDYNLTTSRVWSMSFGQLTNYPAGLHVYGAQDSIGGTTNYERAVFDWNIVSNSLVIGTQAGGTGTIRPIRWTGLSSKATPIGADSLLLLDSASSGDMKTVLISTLPGGGGSGTTILDGSGAPSTGLGAIGDYYVDNDGNQLYGPKELITPVSPDQIAIPPSAVPATYYGGGTSDVGGRFTLAVAGEIIAVRYYREATASQIAHTVNVWTTGGTLLATASVVNDGGGSGWKQVALTTPLVVTAATTIVASTTFTHNYVITPGDTFPISNGGDVTLDTACFSPTPGFPAYASTDNWFVDIVFKETLSATLNWPMAVDGDITAIGAAITSATTGSVLFAGTGGVLAQDNANFFWDNTLKELHTGLGGYWVTSHKALYVVPHASGNNWFEGAGGNTTATGFGNFGTGDGVLYSLTTGSGNVGVGGTASVGGFKPTLFSTTTGDNNLGVGSSAMMNNTVGSQNVAIGNSALASGLLNNQATALGYNTFLSLGISTPTYGNIGIGYGVGQGLSYGDNNCIVGTGSASHITAGTGNTVIGGNAFNNIYGGSYNTWIGAYNQISYVPSIDRTIMLAAAGDSPYSGLDRGWTTDRPGFWVWTFGTGGGNRPVGVHVYNILDSTPAPVNYERAVLDWGVASNIFTIGTEAGGTGTLRLMALGGFPKAGAPAASDLPANYFAVIDDTSAGQTWLVFNKAGTIRKVQLT